MHKHTNPRVSETQSSQQGSPAVPCLFAGLALPQDQRGRPHPSQVGTCCWASTTRLMSRRVAPMRSSQLAFTHFSGDRCRWRATKRRMGLQISFCCSTTRRRRQSSWASCSLGSGSGCSGGAGSGGRGLSGGPYSSSSSTRVRSADQRQPPSMLYCCLHLPFFRCHLPPPSPICPLFPAPHLVASHQHPHLPLTLIASLLLPLPDGSGTSSCEELIT